MSSFETESGVTVLRQCIDPAFAGEVAIECQALLAADFASRHHQNFSDAVPGDVSVAERTEDELRALLILGEAGKVPNL